MDTETLVVRLHSGKCIDMSTFVGDINGFSGEWTPLGMSMWKNRRYIPELLNMGADPLGEDPALGCVDIDTWTLDDMKYLHEIMKRVQFRGNYDRLLEISDDFFVCNSTLYCKVLKYHLWLAENDGEYFVETCGVMRALARDDTDAHIHELMMFAIRQDTRQDAMENILCLGANPLVCKNSNGSGVSLACQLVRLHLLVPLLSRGIELLKNV